MFVPTGYNKRHWCVLMVQAAEADPLLPDIHVTLFIYSSISDSNDFPRLEKKFLPCWCSILVWWVVPLARKLRLRMCLSSELSRTRNEPSGVFSSLVSASSQLIGPQYQPNYENGQKKKKKETFINAFKFYPSGNVITNGYYLSNSGRTIQLQHQCIDKHY